jgi:hypothetical protein
MYGHRRVGRNGTRYPRSLAGQRAKVAKFLLAFRVQSANGRRRMPGGPKGLDLIQTGIQDLEP